MTDRISKILELQKETQTLPITVLVYNNMIPLHLNGKLPKVEVVRYYIKC